MITEGGYDIYLRCTFDELDEKWLSNMCLKTRTKTVEKCIASFLKRLSNFGLGVKIWWHENIN